jgi:hypothetical protein
MERSVYVLDANVFIEAKRRYYAFDIAPKFWDSLIQHADNGEIESIDKVKKELEKGKGKNGEEDDLARWANSNFSHAFHSTDERGCHSILQKDHDLGAGPVSVYRRREGRVR